jgi:hypothetical protein
VLNVRFDAQGWVWHGAMAHAKMRLGLLDCGDAAAGSYQAR